MATLPHSQMPEPRECLICGDGDADLAVGPDGTHATSRVHQRALWDEVLIGAVPFLRELRELVLERAIRKFPRWRFRLAPDLLCQLQPRPIDATVRERGLGPLPPFEEASRFFNARQKLVLFEGRAIAGADVQATDFEHRRPEVRRCDFRILDRGDDEHELWAFKLHGLSYDPAVAGSRVLAWWLPTRVRDALSPDFGQDRVPAHFLSDHCLVCGKALWDPPSIARRIGPECAGTGRAVSPVYRMIRTGEGDAR